MGGEGNSSVSCSSSSKMGGSICEDSNNNNSNEEEFPHVLVVDDNPIDRKLIEKLLITFSCKVTTADSGMRALEYLGLGEDQQQNNSEVLKVNLILTDYCMPGMTGYDLLKKIKESSHMRDVPVVIMSSENVQTRINKCLEEGARMFFSKPLKQSDIETLRSQVMLRRN